MAHLKTSFSQGALPQGVPQAAPSRPTTKIRRTVVTRVHEAIKAVALCHNVTPVFEQRDSGESSEIEADQQNEEQVTYQASSPDEVCNCCIATCHLPGLRSR